jgi:hypothetical protein
MASIARPWNGTHSATTLSEDKHMSIKQVIVSTSAAVTIALSGALFAETASEQAAAAAGGQTDAAAQQAPGTTEQYKQMKVDEATAADEKFHANRTEANMRARDKAEADAAAAAGMAHPMDPTGR